MVVSTYFRSQRQAVGRAAPLKPNNAFLHYVTSTVTSILDRSITQLRWRISNWKLFGARALARIGSKIQKDDYVFGLSREMRFPGISF